MVGSPVRVQALAVGKTWQATPIGLGTREVDSAFSLMDFVLSCLSDPSLKGCRRKYRVRVLLVNPHDPTWCRIVGTFSKTMAGELVDEKCVKAWQRIEELTSVSLPLSQEGSDNV